MHPITVVMVAFQTPRAVLAATVAARSGSFGSDGETQINLGLLLHFICSPLCLSLRLFAHQRFRFPRILGLMALEIWRLLRPPKLLR